MRMTVALACVSAILGPVSLATAGEKEHDICTGIGPANMEILGENHSIAVDNFTCVVQSGPMKGAVLTGNDIVEWNGGVGNLIAGSGVLRMPGSTQAYNLNEGKITLTVDNGKVVGWHGEGNNTVTLATGIVKETKGKKVSWTAKPTGPGQFEIDAEFSN